MKYTLEPGRQIFRDGKPFISINREGRTQPADADDCAHAILRLLNDDWERLGYPQEHDLERFRKPDIARDGIAATPPINQSPNWKRGLRYGTPYFVSKAKAAQYYRDYEGDDGYAAVDRKLAEGSIHIGKPPLPPGARLNIIDNGTRYEIEEV